MRRSPATFRSAPAGVVLSPPLPEKVGPVRSVLPWMGGLLMAFLLFRLLFGHLYVMRGVCECGQVEQWYEFNDRPYTIGVRLSPKPMTIGNIQHGHLYVEPVRTQRY